MHMIRHYTLTSTRHKFTNLDLFADFGEFDPFGLDDFADFVEVHLFVENGSEQAFPMVGAYGYVCPKGAFCPAGYEIRAFLGVIVLLQSAARSRQAVGVTAAGVVGWHWGSL
jgi:hypothetical protein